MRGELLSDRFGRSPELTLPRRHETGVGRSSPTRERIALPDEDGEIGPVPMAGGGHKPEPELERLSNILKAFNDLFGNIGWTDSDRVQRPITEDIPAGVAADKKYQNAQRNSDKGNARIEHDKALIRVMNAVLKDYTELFKQFSDNESFRRWLSDTVFNSTYGEAPPAA